MTTKPKNSYSNVISINPDVNSYVNSTSGLLTNIKTPSFNKETFYISYLSTKYFITARIDISKNISDEDIEDAITNKVYDELALDQAVVYQIKFIEVFTENDNENRYFYLFIIDPLILDNLYKETINKVKYIDVIIPSPLLLRSLYVNEIIESSSAHCFVYFQETDAFVTIYNKKEFLYTKSINYSFSEMYERFCELYGEKVEYDDFINFLLTEDLKDTKSDYKKYIIKLYKEILLNVSEVLTYVKRAYEIESIEHLYIGTEIPIKIKFDEIAEFEMDIESSEFLFDYGFKTDNHVSQLHSLMHIYTSLDENEKYECNFSPFHRPPKFFKRKSGQFLIFTLIAFIISFAYPISYLSLSYAKTLEYNLLEMEYTEVHNDKNKRETIINAKELDKNKINKLVKKEEDNYNSKKSTLIKIHDIKVNYPMKAKLLSILIKDMRKYNVSLESLSYFELGDKKQFIFNLVSLKNKNITNFIKYLTKEYKGKYTFYTENINYNDSHKKYFCILKVNLL